MTKVSDFRSDTVTRPTPAMYEAMAKAPLGDDVLGDEPTVAELENLAAEMLGKEAGLFVPSGTQSNQIAIALHCAPGEELICDFHAHTYNNESGAIARIAHAQVRPVHGKLGVMDPSEVEALIRPDALHQPRTSLINVENTANSAGGTIVPLENIHALHEVARHHGLAYHLDGARLWNAHVATGVGLKEWAAPFDSISVCLSKGLASPVGSVLLGTREFIDDARYLRKQLGGGMRQAGILAACGIVSLTTMIDRLAEDHANAKALGDGMAAIDGIEVEMEGLQTNMVWFSIAGRENEFPSMQAALAEAGVLALHLGRRWRMVCHNDVDASDVSRAVDAWGSLMSASA